ncbi:MAG: saccharopine dehydrogenase NADP-binding domain-containing protein [Flammeovirgaceae bacterium]|nr:MAG: saccharopine dehydrogenase NADP-binding domain-containing protein [Flammeovirgaceae bacterium]
MKTILVLGAGRSSSALIAYLLEFARKSNNRVVVGDLSYELACEKVRDVEAGRAIAFNITDDRQSAEAIRTADVVISLLPPQLHPTVARHCLTHAKHLLTASYVSEEMQNLHDAATQKGLLFLNECGLDPGIDHMSAMEIIHRIKQTGGKLKSFESFTGGLVAPDTDPENPWRYKFTWNPRNVVMAGQGTAKYLHNGIHKYIPYHQLFKRTTAIMVPGYGQFEGYANRNSLTYINAYGLDEIKTMLRGTLRYKGFCKAWDILVQLGCCDDTYTMKHAAGMTHADFIEAFLVDGSGPVQQRLVEHFGLHPDGDEIKRLSWSGFFSDEKIGLTEGTPAQITEHILNKKWKLNAADKDMIVMWHRFVYETGGKQHEIQSSLVVTGEDSVNTAMAKTVGLPLGMAARLLIEGKIKATGVQLPIRPEIYTPILKELKEYGIGFKEQERTL